MLDPVLEYINTGKTIVLVGAGVSAEVGLPSWKALTTALLESCGRLTPAERKALSDLVESGAYSQVLGTAKRQLGDEQFYAECRRLLADFGRRGRVAEFIVRFPFAAIFTTNLDKVLERHAEQAKRELSVFLNRGEDFEQLNVDLLPSLVKLHGDLDRPETVILTDAEYNRVTQAQEFENYRKHVASYFLNRQMLMIGYSAGDPDIRQFLREATAYGRRKGAPAYAILANCTSERAAELYRLYNIQVVRYRADGDHQALVRMFESLQPFITDKPKWAEPREDLRRSQAMYLWSRFTFTSQIDSAQIDSIKSLLLSVLADKSLSAAELTAAAAAVVGLGSQALSQSIEKAVVELARDGYVSVDAGTIALTASGQKLVSAAGGQGGRLRDAFVGQVKLDLATALPKSSEELRGTIAALVEECLVEVFKERGVELVRSAFGQTAMVSEGSVGLFSTLNRAAESLEDESRYSFIKYMVDVLTRPSQAQRAYLEHLALSFFSLEALAMDPDGQRFRREYLGGRGLLVDANVLIDVLPPSGRAVAKVAETLAQAKSSGIPLFASTAIVEEIRQHGLWAGELVRKYGENSVQVLQAALGEGYGENEFLEGFINHVVDKRAITFPAYLRESVGGLDFNAAGIGTFLNQKYGIQMLDFAAIAMKHPELHEQREKNQTYIRQNADARNIDKSDLRIRTEAEAYTLISNWPKVGTDASPKTPATDVAFLSGGYFLNHLAQQGPFRIGHAVCVRRDALFALCARAGGLPPKSQSFRELLVSPMFDASTHFLDRAKYEAFFSPLIQRAERIYRDELPRFRKELDELLLPDTITEIDPLERPVVLAGLQESLSKQLEARAAQQEIDRKRAAEAEVENLRLREELGRAAKMQRAREKEEATQRSRADRVARREEKRLAGRRRKEQKKKKRR